MFEDIPLSKLRGMMGLVGEVQLGPTMMKGEETNTLELPTQRPRASVSQRDRGTSSGVQPGLPDVRVEHSRATPKYANMRRCKYYLRHVYRKETNTFLWKEVELPETWKCNEVL